MAIGEMTGNNLEQEASRDLTSEFQSVLTLEPDQLKKMRYSIGKGDTEKLPDDEIVRRYIEYAGGTTIDPNGKIDEERQKSVAIGSALAFKKSRDEVGLQRAVHQIKDLFGADTEEDCKKALEEIENNEGDNV